MFFLPPILAIASPAADAGVAARLQRRDPRALGELYDRYGRMAFSLIVRIVRDPAVAEDLVQETFLRLWSRVPAFDRDNGAIGPWLLAIARRRAIDYLRSRPDFEQSDDPALFTHLERDLLLPANAQRVKAALRKLPPDNREALELAYFEGLSPSEMAERLGQPLATVETRVRAALKTLREDLGMVVTA